MILSMTSIHLTINILRFIILRLKLPENHSSMEFVYRSNIWILLITPRNCKFKTVSGLSCTGDVTIILTWLDHSNVTDCSLVGSWGPLMLPLPWIAFRAIWSWRSNNVNSVKNFKALLPYTDNLVINYFYESNTNIWTPWIVRWWWLGLLIVIKCFIWRLELTLFVIY